MAGDLGQAVGVEVWLAPCPHVMSSIPALLGPSPLPYLSYELTSIQYVKLLALRTPTPRESLTNSCLSQALSFIGKDWSLEAAKWVA